MDFNMVTVKNSPAQTQLTRNPNETKQRLRRKLISLSKDVRELKETTGEKATVFVATKDKKLYCVTGQHRVQDMRVRRVPRVDVSEDQTDESSEIENMGMEELELYRLNLLELRKNLRKVVQQKTGTAGGSFAPPLLPSWKSSATVAGDDSDSSTDPDASATSIVSREPQYGLGGRRMRRSFE